MAVDASDLLRGALLQLSDSDTVRRTVTKAPVSRSVVARYVAGHTVADAVRVSGELRATNRLVTIDYLGEDTSDRARAEATRDTYVELLGSLSATLLLAVIAFQGLEARYEALPTLRRSR